MCCFRLQVILSFFRMHERGVLSWNMIRNLTFSLACNARAANIQAEHRHSASHRGSGYFQDPGSTRLQSALMEDITASMRPSTQVDILLDNSGVRSTGYKGSRAKASASEKTGCKTEGPL